MKNDYKQTSIGKIPKEWDIQHLGKNINVYSGYAFKRKDYVSYNTESMPIIKIGNLQDGRIELNSKTNYVSRNFYDELPEYRLEQGDVLIALSGATTGKIAVMNKDIGPALLNQRVGIFRIKDNKVIKKQFFYYLSQFNKFNNSIIRYIGQSAQGNLSPSQIEKIRLPVPPLPEQEKIAEILSSVDDGIQKVDEAIKKTERLKKGLMRKLFTEGIGHKEFKKTKIGNIPKEWKVTKVKNILTLEYGKGLTETERKKGPFPVFGSNGIVGYHSKFLVEGPGIVIGRKGTIGATVKSNKNFWPIDTTYYINLKNDINLNWIYYKFCFLNLEKLNMATGTPGLNRNLVYELFITIPTKLEQQKIAEILTTVDRKLQLQKERKEKLERIKKGLMQDLLTGRKRVKV